MDNLFEAFDNENTINISQHKIIKDNTDKDIKFIGKKKERDNEEYTTASISQEKTEDILLAKRVNKITLNIKLNNNNEISEEQTLKDPSLKYSSFDFKGGFHEIIFPEKSPITSLIEPTSPPATTYPFSLDPFQERAILCLENNQTVLVSAHTSAGKTVVAEYAIAMALRDHQRVIYTSPIKALSNQKYRELQKKFNDVGLMTGDVTINAESSCLVMTTEILRNMLYKGSEITKEIAWVIFDEVHYMRDKRRGVVWEETMILLSNKINYVFLSATIPNAREFAMWICKIKNHPCNVIYTDFRPVPLQHFVYPKGSDEIYLAVDDKGNFREENFNAALSKISKVVNNNNNIESSIEDDIKTLVDLINTQELSPAIFFSFSKIECVDLTNSLSNIDLTNEDEKELIEKIYMSAMMTLSTEDQNLPQIIKMLPILKRGIGIHHGGMLPIIKECVELIFQEGLIKILFATETFSMGINMPAKTVVFTSLEKFDGNKKRTITSGEFIQMSGRAGRRGIDDKGLTIIILKNKIDPDKVRDIINGKSDPLNSSYSLSYNQIINMCRIDGVKSEYLVKRSFRQYQSERAISILKNKIQSLYNEYAKYEKNWERDDLIREIIALQENVDMLREENRKIKVKPQYISKYLQSGRFVLIKNWGIGMVANINKEKKLCIYNESVNHYQLINPDQEELNDSEKRLSFVDMIVYIKSNNDENSNSVFPENISERNGKVINVLFEIQSLDNITTIQIKLPNNELSVKAAFKKNYIDIWNKFKNKIPLLNNQIENQINDENFINNKRLIEERETKLLTLKNKVFVNYGNEISINSSFLISSYKSKVTLRLKIKSLIQDYNEINKLILQEEMNNMKRVLHRLFFIENEVVTLKGQVACNISSAEEVPLTEMLFNGSFNNLDEESLAALLSCFLTSEGTIFKKEEEKIEKNSHLFNLYKIVKDNCEKVADVLIENKININKDNYIAQFKYDYMDAIYKWAKGEKTFGEICTETEIYEGNIIRNIRRLDELIRELSNCAKIIGNINLSIKFDKTSQKIKRGIPFAASLYLSS